MANEHHRSTTTVCILPTSLDTDTWHAKVVGVRLISTVRSTHLSKHGFRSMCRPCTQRQFYTVHRWDSALKKVLTWRIIKSKAEIPSRFVCMYNKIISVFISQTIFPCSMCVTCSFLWPGFDELRTKLHSFPFEGFGITNWGLGASDTAQNKKNEN